MSTNKTGCKSEQTIGSLNSLCAHFLEIVQWLISSNNNVKYDVVIWYMLVMKWMMWRVNWKLIFFFFSEGIERVTGHEIG